MDQGWLYLYEEDYRRAEDCFQSIRDALGDSLVTWRVDYGLGRCAGMHGRTDAAMQHYLKATAQVSRLRQRFANQEYSSSLFTSAQYLYDDAIALALDREDPETVLLLIEEHRSLVLQRQIASTGLHFSPEIGTAYKQQAELLRAMVEDNGAPGELDTALSSYLNTILNARHSNPLPDHLLINPLNLGELRKQLEATFPDWIILLYTQCKGELVVVVIDSGHIDIQRTPLDDALKVLLKKACLKRWRNYVFSNPDFAYLWNKSRQRWSQLTELGERLLPTSVRKRLRPDTRLLIVPGGPLHDLPWATLRIGTDWLCQRAVVQVLPSLSIWSHLVRQPVYGEKALLLGCSSFGSRASPLPHIADELDLVDRCWRGRGLVERMEDGKATRQALRTLASGGELKQFQLLHIGTHAQLLPDQSVQAHIKLWDEDMLLDEVTELRLGGGVVVLATCDGANGAVAPGEEVRSLSYAFLAAGARDVVANIWSFYGELTQGILEEFYHGLARKLDAPTALAQALRELLKYHDDGDGALPTRSPIVWGGLIAQGAGTVPGHSAGGTNPASDHST
ncbi:MAG: CHAT domain-containing protein [Chloroflexaceae bacterium]|nr:CHAT domain-containing protein [Chloroflexaceae bacterium]